MLMRHRLMPGMVALLVLLGWSFAPGRATPASADQQCYVLAAVHSGHHLDVEGGSYSNGAHIIQWYQTYRSNQKWRFQPVPDTTDVYYIQSVHSGKYITWQTERAGSPVVQMDFTGGYDQRWLHFSQGGIGEMYTTYGGMELTLDIAGASYQVGAWLILWTPNDSNHSLNQRFIATLTPC
jgi:hypothetical protein